MDSIFETREYLQWLGNFPEQYHPVANRLVAALHYLDDSTFRSNLAGLIRQELTTGSIPKPALVVPMRTGTEMGLPKSERAVMFENVFPAHPLAAPDTGSEALCANIVRNIRRGQGSQLGMLSIPCTLNAFRKQKARSIVLVGDYSGSGSQAIEATKIWTRNPSIRSWRSYRRIRTQIILHSASVSAIEALNRESSIDDLFIVSAAKNFDTSDWSTEQRKEVEEFCARFAKNSQSGLGWKESAGLFVMQHKAPNNLPMILWQTNGKSRREDGWYPLFPAGDVPSGLSDVLAMATREQKERTIDKRVEARKVLGPLQLRILHSISHGARSAERISAFTDVPLMQSKQVLSELADDGYTTPRGYLTDLGRKILDADTTPKGMYRLIGSDDPYYPQALR